MANSIRELLKAHQIEDLDLDDTVKQRTGIPTLDETLQGGLPVGKMVEFYGSAGGGKSALAMEVAAEVQKAGGTVLWLDLESAYNPVTAAKAGIVTKDLVYIDAGICAEEALAIIEDAAITPEIDLIVVDSVAGMTPRAEINGDFGDSHVGLVARLMSQACRKIQNSLGEVENPATIIWINQIRATIGTMGYGPQSTTTGGKALGFYCSTRLEIVRTGNIKKGEEITGQHVKVTVRKARYSPPFATANFDVIYETGVSRSLSMIEMALNAGVFVKSGSWITNTLSGEKLQGAQSWAKCLDEDDEAFAEVEAAITTEQV